MPALPTIIANWKSNGSLESLLSLTTKLRQVSVGNIRGIFCPPSPYLLTARQHTGLLASWTIGAQGCDTVAGTGALPAKIFKDVGCRYVITGHCERRDRLQQSDEIIAQEYINIIQAGLVPILCMGHQETNPLGAEEAAKNLAHSYQLLKEHMGNTILPTQKTDWIFAYEPRWAIGSQGPSAEYVGAIRAHLWQTLPPEDYPSSFVYGGGVTPEMALELVGEGHADGIMLGRLSLQEALLLELCEKFSTLKAKHATREL